MRTVRWSFMEQIFPRNPDPLPVTPTPPPPPPALPPPPPRSSTKGLTGDGTLEVEPIVLVYAVRYALPRSHAMAMTLLPIFEHQAHRIPQDHLAAVRRDIAQHGLRNRLHAPWRELYVVLGGDLRDLPPESSAASPS